MIRYAIVILLAILATSCSRENSSTVQSAPDLYFDLSKLLDNQVEHLVQQKASLDKLMTSNEEQEQVSIRLDSAGDWKTQLSLFYEADINKPGFEGAYFLEELPAINGSSKMIYTAKNQKLQVQVMECIYINSQLEQVRLLIVEKNAVFNIQKEMNLYFEDQNLKSFKISGEESMAMKKDLSYSIEASVVYP